MVPILFFFSCASDPSLEDIEGAPQTTVPISDLISKKNETEEKISSENESSQTSVPTEAGEIDVPPLPKIESIPSAQIEGMATKSKPKRITAEEIEAYFEENKNRFEKNDEKENKVKNIVVQVEKIHNARYNDINSSIFVRVYKDPKSLGSFFGHDHVILAHGWEGQVIWKESEPHNCHFEFQVPVHFLEADPDTLRAKVGFEDRLSSKEKKQFQENMFSESQLWAQKHPHINFSATSCSVQDDNVRITGKIKIRGKTVPIETTMKITTEKGLSIQGSFHLNQTSFGITPYSGLMGSIKLLNRFTIDIQLSE